MAGINGVAVSTGASCGVGFALAKQFAKRGYDLIVADSDEEIDTAAAALSVLGTEVEPVNADMHCVDDAYLLYRRAIAVGKPVVAAALSMPPPDGHLDGSLDSALEEVDDNVRATMLLARLLADEMVLHGSGSIVLTASPPKGMSSLDAAVYSAGSAFLHTYAQTLQQDLRGTGVKVAALVPQPAEQDSAGVVDLLLAAIGRVPTSHPSSIARQALQALESAEKHNMATRVAGAVTSLACRILTDRVRGPVGQIISPTGEAV